MDIVDIIYIEDEDTIALIFKLGLTPYHINVLHLPDIQPENLALLDTPPYQTARALFFDLWVNGVSGLDLAQQLREKGDQRPFFLLTAGENPDSNILKQINMTFIQKPVGNFRKLAEMIRAL